MMCLDFLQFSFTNLNLKVFTNFVILLLLVKLLHSLTNRQYQSVQFLLPLSYHRIADTFLFIKVNQQWFHCGHLQVLRTLTIVLHLFYLLKNLPTLLFFVLILVFLFSIAEVNFLFRILNCLFSFKVLTFDLQFILLMIVAILFSFF